MAKMITRRRAILIMAAAAGLPLLSRAAYGKVQDAPLTWNGIALGAPATLILNMEDRDRAGALINRVVAEIVRLERIFSLYRMDSVLCGLNKEGAMAAPPPELVEVLEMCQYVWQTSDRLFDPTVQPLWTLYANHFAKSDPDPAGPNSEDIRTALASVGFENIKFNRTRVVFTRRQMALTLNGIAQGYITDKIVELLRAEGITSSLVDMGEVRAIGNQSDGQPWRVGLSAADGRGQSDAVLKIKDKSVSTSSASGFQFDETSGFGHILNPLSGQARSGYARLTVVGERASMADAFSTAFSLMEPDRVKTTVASEGNLSVDLVSLDGGRQRFGPDVW
jgi:FAD:protein FMN transferase